MKKGLFSIALSAIFVLSFVFLACNRGTKEIQPNSTASEQVVRRDKSGSQDPYAIYGQMHNAGLSHFKNNFQIPSGNFSTEQKVDLIDNQLKLFLNQTYQLTPEQQNWVNTASAQYKKYVKNEEAKQDYITNFSSYENQLLQVHQANLMDNIEYGLVKRLMQVSKKAFENNIEPRKFLEVIDSVKLVYQSQNYPSDMSRGAFGGLIVSISSHSKQWWLENPDFGGLPVDGNGNDVNAVPPALIAAIAGDVAFGTIGAVGNAIGQLIQSLTYGTEFSVFMFLWSGAYSAVMGSLASGTVLKTWILKYLGF